jgi:hypothetical protein
MTMRLHDLLEATLSEAPLGDYNLIGNWDKNASMRGPDRKMLSNPTHVERLRQKFGNTHYDFQIFVVNVPGAAQHLETGQVDMAWIHKAMPKVAEEIEQLTAAGRGIKEDSINFIFTNNSASEKIPLTPWIMAHRMGHALPRKNGMTGRDHGAGYAFIEAEKYLVDGTNLIFEEDYGIPPTSLMNTRGDFSLLTASRTKNRQLPLLYKSFWSAIGTFRSARDNNLRDAFEMTNELIAQYIITGGIKFNPLPAAFQVPIPKAYGQKRTYRLQPDAEGTTDSLANTMEYAIGDILSSAVSHIYVM